MGQDNLQGEMIALYKETAEMTKKFHKKTYAGDMEKLKADHGRLLDDIKKACEESDESLLRTASYIPEYVMGELDAVASKRKRDLAVIDHNMTMVSYFVPLMGEVPSLLARTFSEKIVEVWNEKMPGNKIGHSTVNEIQGGFRKGLCYITTAVCRSQNKADDCYELSLLRDYRDGYLLGTEEGDKAVAEYYNIAPTIVKRIDHDEHAEEIYNEIWKNYVSPCVRLIEEDKKAECEELYSDMVRRLEKKYLYS